MYKSKSISASNLSRNLIVPVSKYIAGFSLFSILMTMQNLYSTPKVLLSSTKSEVLGVNILIIAFNWSLMSSDSSYSVLIDQRVCFLY